MYNFIDVTAKASDVVLLPSEALMLNGQYIENQIKGYRTLHVQGREALSPELSTYETGIRDGSKRLYKRFPARVIIVTYQLIAESNEAFREAYNKLGGILNVEDAEMIFADEPDKFFTGTPSLVGEVEPGKNSVIGTIEFLCTDPFKYSVVEYTATTDLDQNSILIDYNGTHKSFPTLQADFSGENEGSGSALSGSGDCGYVAFFTEDEKIIQLGDPDEVDGSNAYAKAQALMNQTFLSTSAWGSTAQALWAMNSGVVLGGDMTQVGSVAMTAASYKAQATSAKAATLLTVSSYANQPRIDYKVSAAVTSRTETAVVLSVSITTSLGSSGSFFGEGYGLKGHLYIGGAWFEVVLKKTSEYWKGKTGHTKSFGLTLAGIPDDQATLTGIKFKVSRLDSLGTAGTLGETACKNLTIGTASRTADSWYLTASNWGSGSKWHGPSITRTLSKDASGAVGATNWTMTWKQKMCIGNKTNSQRELGGFHMNCLAADGTVVAGIRVVKNKAGKNAILFLHINGVSVLGTSIDLSYNNKYFGAASNSVQTCSITKVGSKFTFNIGGLVKTYTNSAMANKAVTRVTFMFEKWGSSAALSYNGLYSAKFVKNNCNTWKDIPNKFSSNDVVTANCENGEIRLNGALAPELGALGNDWEGFVLTPGLNQIGFAYSDWVASAPEIKVKYREVFL